MQCYVVTHDGWEINKIVLTVAIGSQEEVNAVLIRMQAEHVRNELDCELLIEEMRAGATKILGLADDASDDQIRNAFACASDEKLAQFSDPAFMTEWIDANVMQTIHMGTSVCKMDANS